MSINVETAEVLGPTTPPEARTSACSIPWIAIRLCVKSPKEMNRRELKGSVVGQIDRRARPTPKRRIGCLGCITAWPRLFGVLSTYRSAGSTAGQ